MRPLVVGAFTTLDGVVQAPGGPDEDRDGGFEHSGWLVPYVDDEFMRIMSEWTVRADAFLLGRKTYDIFAGSWPKSTDPADEIGAALNSRPKFVASRTRNSFAWNNSHLLEGVAADAVARLKAEQGGEIQVHGSANLIQTLLGADLVDTLRIWQFPVVLGTGKRLFDAGVPPRTWRLVESAQNTKGAVLHVFEREGGLKYGEMEVGANPTLFERDA